MDKNQKEIQGFLKLKDEELLAIEGGNSIGKYIKEFIERLDKGNAQSENDHPIKMG